MLERGLKDKQLQELYLWVDGIPLSRPKRNMARDFSDAGTFHCSLKFLLHKQSHTTFLKQWNYTTTYQQAIYKQNIAIGKHSMVLILQSIKRQGTQETKDHTNKIINNSTFKLLTTLCIETNFHNKESNLRPTIIVINIKGHQKQQTKVDDPAHTITTIEKATNIHLQINVIYINKQPYRLKNKDIKQIITNKDQQIQTLKQTLQLCALKFSKLDQAVKSKDKQIQQLVKKIKNKGIM